MDTNEFENEMRRLHEEKARLRRTIELALESVKSLELSAMSAELLNRGCLSSEREAWIRATVHSKDRPFIDSLYIQLEEITKKISSLKHKHSHLTVL